MGEADNSLRTELWYRESPPGWRKGLVGTLRSPTEAFWWPTVPCPSSKMRRMRCTTVGGSCSACMNWRYEVVLGKVFLSLAAVACVTELHCSNINSISNRSKTSGKKKSIVKACRNVCFCLAVREISCVYPLPEPSIGSLQHHSAEELSYPVLLRGGLYHTRHSLLFLSV